MRHPKEERFAHWLGRNWVFAALLWFSAGCRLFAYFGLLTTGSPAFFELDRRLFYCDEVFLSGQVVCLAIGLGGLLTGRRAGAVAAGAAGAASMAAFLALLFAQGVAETIQTSWASEHEIPHAAFVAFLPGYALSLLLIVCAIIQEVWRRWRGLGANRLALAPLLAALLYAAAGIVDVRGVWAGWRLLLIRLTYLLAALITLWVARPVDPSLRLVRHRRPV
jgi:hypothetical protein